MSFSKIFLFLLVVFILPQSTFTDARDVVRKTLLIIVPSGEKASRIAHTLKKRLQSEFSIKVAERYQTFDGIKPDLTVAISSTPYYQYAPSVNSDVLIAFDDIYKPPLKPGGTEKHSVYPSPTPESVATLLSKTFTRARIGYIYTHPNEPFLNALTSSLGSNIELVPVDQSGSVFKALNELISNHKVDGVLINNNGAVFNSKNIRFILEALFRERVAAVGMTRQLVGAGASLAIWTDEDAVLDHVLFTIRTYMNAGAFPQSKFPQRTEISFDRYLLREYRMKLPEARQ